MDVRRILPTPTLRTLVRSFGERRATLGSRTISFPMAARPHQIIDIYLGDPLRVRVEDGPLETAPDMVIVGPQASRRMQIYASGDLHIFNIVLQPAALHQLFGIDVEGLTGSGVLARDVFGGASTKLESAVRSALDFPARVAAAERWFATMLEDAPVEDKVAEASRQLIVARGNIQIDALAKHAELSSRQFQRRFTRQVGLPPKLYARTIRFDAALNERRNQPTKSWTRIIQDAGYFDQAHFIKECHALVGLSPREFIGDWDNVFSLNV